MSHIYIPLDKLKTRAIKRCHLNKHLVTEAAALPRWGTVKNYSTSIYDQGQLGSCTANAFCGSYCIQENIKSGSVSFSPSRLFLYYYERVVEDTDNSPLTDSGADVIDGANYVQQKGICSEASWPYDISKFNDAPPSTCLTEALQHKISSYHTIPLDANLLSNIKQSILNKVPVLIAIAVYDSFESQYTANTGMVTIPQSTEQNLGGHELCLVGYNDDTQLFTVQNSWGQNWGHGGFCYIPYAYLTNANLASEFTVFYI